MPSTKFLLLLVICGLIKSTPQDLLDELINPKTVSCMKIADPAADFQNGIDAISLDTELRPMQGLARLSHAIRIASPKGRRRIQQAIARALECATKDGR